MSNLSFIWKKSYCRRKAGLLLGRGPSLKMQFVCFLCFFLWVDFQSCGCWLTSSSRLMYCLMADSIVVVGLVCFHWKKKHQAVEAPLFSGLRLWQNFYRADCSDKETVGHSETDQRVCDTFNYLLGTSDWINSFISPSSLLLFASVTDL